MRGYLVDQQHSVFGQQQLVVQRAFFAAAFPETPDDLYARATMGALTRERQRVAIQPHARLSTNTLFGRFPADYWQRWTDLTQVEFSVIVQGTGRLTIRTSDLAGDTRTVATATVVGADHDEVRLLPRIDTHVDGAALWFEASTGVAELVLESASWSITKREEIRPPVVVMRGCNRAYGRAPHPHVSPQRSERKEWTIKARNSAR